MKKSSKRRRLKYSRQFKRDAVALTEERPVSVVAKELGIPYSVLVRWRQQHHESLQPNEESLSHEELLSAYKQLQEHVAQQQRTHQELTAKYKEMEKDHLTEKAINSILRKAPDIFSQDSLKKDLS